VPKGVVYEGALKLASEIDAVFRVDFEPAILLAGEVPAYRAAPLGGGQQGVGRILSSSWDTATTMNLPSCGGQQPPPPQPAAAGASNGGREPQLLAASEAGIELGPEATTVSVQMPSQSREAVARAADPSTEDRLRLDVEVDEDPGIVYQVYINLPSEQDGEEVKESHFVGHVTFFGAKRLPADSEHDHPGGLRRTFDITPVVQELRERGIWDEEKVDVTFVPLGLLPPPGEQAEEWSARAGLPAGPEPQARIGRVSIVRE
jgi:tyrosinase